MITRLRSSHLSLLYTGLFDWFEQIIYLYENRDRQMLLQDADMIREKL